MKKTIHITIAMVILLCIVFSLNAQEKEAVVSKKVVTKEVKTSQPVQMKDIAPFSYCALLMVGSYDQHDVAFDSLYTEAGKQGIDLETTPFGIYYDNPENTPEEELTWELGFKVNADVKVSKPLVKNEWKFEKVMSAFYEGSFESESYADFYEKLFKRIYGMGYEAVGPMMENFLSMPEMYPDGTLGGKVEIWVPIRKMKMPEKIKKPEKMRDDQQMKPHKKLQKEVKKEIKEKQE